MRFTRARPGGAAVCGAGAQIKARVFEVCGAGGFLLSGGADNFGDYYDLSREVWVFRDGRELLDAARRALADESARKARAEAARRRTLQEHTYRRRFEDIFALIGLPETARRGGELPGVVKMLE